MLNVLLKRTYINKSLGTINQTWGVNKKQDKVIVVDNNKDDTKGT